MAIPLAVAAGISLLPSVFKGISGIIQSNRAKKINPVNPNYQMNNEVIDNARRLSDRASNYNLPGYTKALSDIGSTYSSAFNQGVQGASSSGDVLDLATKIAYGQANATSDLNARNAMGRENAYMQSLQANAQAGQEYQNKNAYERDLYQQQLREKAALQQAGNENIYGAINDASSAGLSLINDINDKNNPNNGKPNNANARITNFLPNQTIAPQLDPLKYNVRTNGSYSSGNPYSINNSSQEDYILNLLKPYQRRV